MRIKLFAIGRTVVYLHAGTLMLAAYMLLIRRGTLLMIGTLSILLHECAHAGVAALLKYPPNELELIPMGAMLRLEQEDSMPCGRAVLMLLAGPAMTAVLCWGSLAMTRWGILSPKTGAVWLMSNLTLLVLNLLPSMPLDGGRLLMQMLRLFLRDATVRRVMRVFSMLIGVGCILGNLWCSWRYGGWNLSLVCAGCVMMYGGAAGTRTNALHELQMFLDRKIRLERRKTMPAHMLVILKNVSLRRAVALLHPRRYTYYWVLDYGMRSDAVLTETQMIEAYLQAPGGSVADALNKGDTQYLHTV